jgi:hypothetical protein
MDIPAVVKSAQVVGVPIAYKWSDDIASSIDDTENVRLYKAVDAASFRAKMAVGAALAEWAIWRFHGLVDTSDGVLRVEAAWTGVVDPKYVNDLEFETTADDDKEAVVGAYQSGLYYLGETAADYLGKNIYLAESVVKQAALARHVMPDKKKFDSWLTETLRRTAAAFPKTSEYDERTEQYDAAAEPPVPRAFVFDPAYVHSDAECRRALADFLAKLDPKRNPYLRSAKEMAKYGFGGTAYRI